MFCVTADYMLVMMLLGNSYIFHIQYAEGMTYMSVQINDTFIALV